MATPSRAPEPEFIKLFCPTCEELHTIELAARPQKVACSFCEAPIQVPSLEQALRHRVKKRAPTPQEVGEYAIAETKPSAPAGKGAIERTGAAPPSPTIIVECPHCHERLETVAGNRPGQVECTFCQASVPVPARDAHKNWKQRPVKPRSPQEIGTYQAAPASKPTPLRMHLFDRLAEIRSEPIPAPPRWTFFSGVFNFPWRSDVLPRWIWLSIGLAVPSLIAMLLATGFGVHVGGLVVVALGFLVMPMFWILLWTLSYAAGCAICIIEATAAGIDRIEAWPEPNWKEWMLQLIYLTWIAAAPTVAAYGIAKLSETQGGPFWPVLCGGFFLMFPIVLLSAMEANSPWVLLSLPVLKSLFVVCGGWLTFYLLTGTLLTLVAVLAGFLQERSILLAGIILGPPVAAAILIYARLLGRLAWKISNRLSR